MTSEELPPPVPPEEVGGDVRIGWQATGVLFLLIGWGAGVVLNLLLHYWAPSSGWRFGPFWIGTAMGSYAWIVFSVGLFMGGFGVVLLHLARGSPRGPLVLPGYPY